MVIPDSRQYSKTTENTVTYKCNESIFPVGTRPYFHFHFGNRKKVNVGEKR